MKFCSCGNSIKNKNSKRCRKCYLESPDNGFSRTFSKEELHKRSLQMSKRRKTGKIKTWNKNKDLWKERPELVINMKNKLKGKRCNPKGEFKKGRKYGLNNRGKLINKHHVDLDQQNNRNNNLLFLTSSDHNSLHRRSYDYLVETGQIKNYIKWFKKKFNPKLYNKQDKKEINKAIVMEEKS